MSLYNGGMFCCILFVWLESSNTFESAKKKREKKLQKHFYRTETNEIRLKREFSSNFFSFFFVGTLQQSAIFSVFLCLLQDMIIVRQSTLHVCVMYFFCFFFFVRFFISVEATMSWFYRNGTREHAAFFVLFMY